MKLEGHKQNVEDICFKEGSADVLCSVGVDRQVLIWDLRAGLEPVITMKEVHSSDINCVDWCSTNDNLIATGSNDTFVKILDVRRALEYDQNKQQPVVKTLRKHKAQVQTVKFSDFSPQYLASSGDTLIFWDLK